MSQMKQLDVIRQEHRDLRIENAKLKAEVKQLEEHIAVVDEFYVPDDKPTTGFADDADGDLSLPQNGYVVLNKDGAQVYNTLDDLIKDQVSFNNQLFNCNNRVYELGAQVRPSTKITWEEVK
jgi:hypothetical protein